MDKCWPSLPVAEGLQTNCWKLALVVGIVDYAIQIIANFASENVGGGINNIINLVFFLMFQYHSLYYTIQVTEEMVEIKGGPCAWCEDWNSKDDVKRWCSAAWCFSSQIYKTDIVTIETRAAEVWPDLFPRYYCSPIVWCCCHKSYNGFYFPCCCDCCEGVQCGGWCDGDQYPVLGMNYVQFNLSESPTACLFPGRCTPNICSACTYNRISYALRDQGVINQLKQCGYTVLETAGSAPVGGGDTGMGTGTGGPPPPQQQQQQTDTNMGGPPPPVQDTGAPASAPAEDAPPAYEGDQQPTQG